MNNACLFFEMLILNFDLFKCGSDNSLFEMQEIKILRRSEETKKY